MNAADTSLRDSINSLAKALSGNDSGVEVGAALRDADLGIREAQQAPVIEGQGETYRRRLIELLNEHRALAERFQQERKGYKSRAVGEFVAIKNAYEQFRVELDPWLVDYMKHNGYELKKTRSDDETPSGRG